MPLVLPAVLKAQPPKGADEKKVELFKLQQTLWLVDFWLF